MQAVKSGYKEAVQQVLDQGVRFNSSEELNSAFTILLSATDSTLTKEKEYCISKMLIEKHKNLLTREMVDTATYRNRTDVLALLLKADINLFSTTNNRDERPLETALRLGKPDAAFFFLKFESSFSFDYPFLNYSELTKESKIMDFAIKHDHVGIAEVLLKRNANLLESKDSDNKTPLQQTIIPLAGDVACYLINQGANISLRDENQNLILHTAIIKSKSYNNSRRLDFLKKLLTTKVKQQLNAQNAKGETPLHLIDSPHEEELMKLLVQECNNQNVFFSTRCSLDIIDNEGNTPLDRYRKQNLDKFTHYLRFKRAHCNTQCEIGETPLYKK